MPWPRGNHLDRQRQLLPSDYVDDPYCFGTESVRRFVKPAAGDPVSAKVARIQHELILGWRRVNDA
jgi:hypothetical protein